MRQIKFWTKALLFATALTPLIITPFTLFPFILGKTIFLWSIAALVAALSVIYLIVTVRRQEWRLKWGGLFNPLLIAITIFIISAAVSTAFAPSSYRGFFGDIERGDGLLSLVAYFILFMGTLFFFERRDWSIYFRLGVLVGAIVIIHVFLRHLGIAFPAAIGATRQPGSFLGNPAFVSSFLILLLGYAALVYRDTKGFWKYSVLAVGLSSVGVVGLLAVRGALVGLATGGLALLLGTAFGGRRFSLKSAAIAILTIPILIGYLFWLTPDDSLWKRLPLLDRVSTFSLEKASVQTRVLSLGISWNAFKERPIFGWGLENYNVAYNKHYNPSYAIYAEDWFDRAHNKILDVLVMQGIVGIISYLGIFMALFYVLRKTEALRGVRLFLSAVLVAYFVQNLFIFDHINSYIPLFLILSFCAFSYKQSRLDRGETVKIPQLGRFLLVGGAVAVVFFAVYSLYKWNTIPLFQAWSYEAVLKKESTAEKVLSQTENFLQPYNFYQKDMRIYFMQLILNSEDLRGNYSHPLFRKALSALEEVASYEPYDPKLMIRLSEVYNLVKDDAEFFKRSIEFIEKAEELSPRRQAIRGAHVLVLSGEDKHKEAIELARETLALEPRAAKSHYYLGMTLALSLKDKEKEKDFENIKKEALRELGIALDYARELALRGDYVLFFESDFRNMMVAYQNLGAKEELIQTYRVAEKFFPENIDYYRIELTVALKHRDAEEIIRIAERIKELDPASAADMDVIIDLTRKGAWEILDDL